MRDIPLRYMGLLILVSLFAGLAISNLASAQGPPPENLTSVRSIDLMQYHIFKGSWKTNAHDGGSVFTDCGNSTLSANPTWNEMLKMTDSESNSAFEGRIGGTQYCPADNSTLQQIHNFTFPVAQNITNLRVIWELNSTEIPTYLWLLNSAGNLLGNVSLQTTTKTTSYLNGTFTNVKHINFIANLGILSTVRALRVFEIAAWDTANKTYPIEFAYADYLAARAQSLNIDCGGGGTGGVCSDMKSGNFSLPPGNGYYFTSAIRSLRPIQGANQCELAFVVTSIANDNNARNITGCQSILKPESYNTQDLSFELLGSSYLHENVSSIQIWRYKNTASVNRVAFLRNDTWGGGISYDADCGSSRPRCIVYPSWYNQIGTLFATCPAGTYANNDCKPSAGTTTTPLGNSTCDAGAHSKTCFTQSPNPSQKFHPMMGFGYKDFTGPLKTIAFESAGWGDTTGDLLDFKNITTVLHFPANAADSQGVFSINLDLHKFDYVGNAIYLILAKQTPIQICDVGNATIIVNGASVELAISAFATNIALNNETVQYCGWFLDDFTLTNSLSVTSGADNPYFDNSLSGRLYEIQLPENLQFNNWRAIQSFGGRHAARIMCNDSAGICFGNYDTQAASVPGVKAIVNWKWNVIDQQTNETIEGANAFDVISSIGGITDANGNVNLTTTTTTVRWSLTKQGYNPHHINFSLLNQDTIYINASMSKLSNRPFNVVTCRIAGNNTLLCTSNATGEAGLTCQEIQGNDGTCRRGPIFGVGLKIIQFGCAVDGSEPRSLKALPNVTAFESLTSVTVVFGSETFGLNNDVQASNCLTGSTTSVQSATQSWAFTKNGYRTLKFSADWLDKTIIKFVPTFKSGRGDASPSDVTFTVTNTTFLDGGIVKPGSIIEIQDAAAATIIGQGVPPIEGLIVNLGIALGFSSVAGKAIWGVLFIAFILGIYAGIHFRATQTERTIGRLPSSRSITFVGGFAFFAVGYIGLFPLELIIIGILIVVITAANAARSYF